MSSESSYSQATRSIPRVALQTPTDMYVHIYSRLSGHGQKYGVTAFRWRSKCRKRGVIAHRENRLVNVDRDFALGDANDYEINVKYFTYLSLARTSYVKTYAKTQKNTWYKVCSEWLRGLRTRTKRRLQVTLREYVIYAVTNATYSVCAITSLKTHDEES